MLNNENYKGFKIEKINGNSAIAKSYHLHASRYFKIKQGEGRPFILPIIFIECIYYNDSCSDAYPEAHENLLKEIDNFNELIKEEYYCDKS